MKYYKEYSKLKKYKYDSKSIKQPHIQDVFVLDFETTSIFYSKKDSEVITFDYTRPPEFYNDYEKIGFVYIWMLSINETVYYGRELSELKDFIYTINDSLQDQSWVIYVHNLAYDFQFLRNVFDFESCFARKKLKPISAKVNDIKLTFKCSYILSNLSLENMSKFLTNTKKVGYLDYNVLRTPNTYLTEKELEYCESDCLVVYDYITLMLSTYKKIQDIPLTNTGKVRLRFKKAINNYSTNKKYSSRNWKDFTNNKNYMSYDSFNTLLKCFSGGYTHANALHAMQVKENVSSYDFTSSYPYVMLAEKYPMTSFKEYNSTLNLNTDNYAFIFTVELFDVKSKNTNTYISLSKTTKVYNTILDNGRIHYSKYIQLTLTDIDFQIILDNYDIGSINIINTQYAYKDYLPKFFTDLIIELYITKNKLKNEKDKKALYNLYKSELNSLYGMTVTNMILDEVEYNSEWEVKTLSENNIIEKLLDLQNDKKYLMPYSWGVWITAYARNNLWDNINKIGDDVVYCDTDSIKYINTHDDDIKKYNEKAYEKIQDFISRNKITDEYTKDQLKLLGQFDYEGTYEKFTTLGAKKYCLEKDNKIEITVSGVNKKYGSLAIKKIEDFKVGLTFNYDQAHKSLLYYNDDQPIIKINNWVLNQKHGVCLQPTTYTLGISNDYKDFIGSAYLNNYKKGAK